jgi:hypothetical protein
MNEDVKEAFEAVQEFNESIDDLNLGVVFELKTDGFCHFITFGDYVLWNSEDDERRYNEASDVGEPMKVFLERQVKNMASSLSEVLGLVIIKSK